MRRPLPSTLARVPTNYARAVPQSKRMEPATEVLQSRLKRSDTLAVDAAKPTSTVQRATFRSRDHRPVCPLVSSVWTQLPESGRTHGRAQPDRRSRHDLALGAALCSRTEPALPPRIAQDEPLVAGGRNLPSRRGQVDLSLPSSGFHRRHD